MKCILEPIYGNYRSIMYGEKAHDTYYVALTLFDSPIHVFVRIPLDSGRGVE